MGTWGSFYAQGKRHLNHAQLITFSIQELNFTSEFGALYGERQPSRQAQASKPPPGLPVILCPTSLCPRVRPRPPREAVGEALPPGGGQAVGLGLHPRLKSLCEHVGCMCSVGMVEMYVEVYA